LSEEAAFWVKLLERLFGVMLILVGGLIMYYVATSLQQLVIYSWLFGFLDVLLMIMGLLLLTAKTE
jgi:hypothetical protein